MHIRQHLRTGAALLGGFLATGPALAAGVALPAEFSVPANSVSERGFTVRIVQGPQDPPLANSYVRALKQLNGTLTDTNNVAVPNEATPGTGPGGAYFSDTINFEKSATQMDVITIDNQVLATFTPELFPGIPGTSAHTDNFATEVVGYLDLPAGETTLGVSVGRDRTDVINDDSFVVLTGNNPRDYFGTKLAEFQRSAPPFTVDTHTESQFVVNAPAAGIYPIRIVYWQTGLGANLNFYTVNNDTGERLLVNDPNDNRAIKSYRASTAPKATAPYVAEISPLAGSEGISASAPIQAVIADGSTTVATSGVKLFLNEAPVVPQTLTKAGDKITLSFSPNAARTEKNNTVKLVFTDSAGVSKTNTWAFGINPASGSSTTVAAQWDFDQGDLRATIGQPLSILTAQTV